MIAVGARCTDYVRANELFMVRGYCLCTVRGVLRVDIDYSTSHVLALGVMDRVDQPMSVAVGCCTIVNWLAATISVCVAYVAGFSMS